MKQIDQTELVNRKEPLSLPKLWKTARTTTLYILVIGIAFVILTPIYFIVAISLMSDHEAYSWPLPLAPEISPRFKLVKTDQGFLLSIRNRADGTFSTLSETKDLRSMAGFVRRKTNCALSEDFLRSQTEKLDNRVEVQFNLARNWTANYRTFFRVTDDAAGAIWRSLYVAVLTIVISLVIGGLAGFAFARYQFRGRNSLKLGVLFVRMFPAVSVAIPMVIILGRIGLYDNPFGLSMVYAVGQIGLTIWITASIFMGIPVELEEAAQVFGASRFGAFWHVTLPLSIPGLAACAMYAFIASWNETLQAIVLTQFNPTFPVLVYQSLVGAKGMVNLAAAGGIIMALPAVIFTLMIRRYILRMWGGVSV